MIAPARTHYVFALGLMFFMLPAFAHAALVNINTADAALLDTLPGIGPSKATAIVDYRTQNGLFASVTDIQKVSGIGPSTYAGIAPFITVGDTAAASTSTASSSTASISTSSGAASIYVPPPSAISVSVTGAQTALLEVPLRLSARVTGKNSEIDPSAQISWSFGDGSSSSGSSIEKVYHYAGTYLIVATAADGATTARAELIVTVKPASVHVSAVSGEGITIMNDSSDRLDLSGWRLAAGTGFFRIPDGMMLLPQSSVLFPSIVTNLPLAFDAALVYPDGVTASRFTPPAAMEPIPPTTIVTEQPSAPPVSYKQTQAVEPIISQGTNVQSHDETGVAPAASTELAAAGAAFVPPSQSADTRASGLFRSPWTFGLLGIMALAGGAFILL